jgi:outer membrane lipoprotein-sorting protein
MIYNILLAIYNCVVKLSKPTLALFFLVIVFLGNSYASPKLQDKNINMKAELSKIEYYLNGITTFVADFTQIAPNGEVSTGKLFLSRPNKLRWQYNPPTPILIVVNGTNVAYYDYELDQLSHSSAEDNISNFLTRNYISLQDDMKITKFDNKTGTTRIQLVKKDKAQEGSLTLTFDNSPLALKKIEVEDSTGQRTLISLFNQKSGMTLDNNLFRLKAPSRTRRGGAVSDME